MRSPSTTSRTGYGTSKRYLWLKNKTNKSIYVLISCVSIVALKSSCFAYAFNLDALALANDSCTFWGCMILVKLMINVSRVGQKRLLNKRNVFILNEICADGSFTNHPVSSPGAACLSRRGEDGPGEQVWRQRQAAGVQGTGREGEAQELCRTYGSSLSLSELKAELAYCTTVDVFWVLTVPFDFLSLVASWH